MMHIACALKDVYKRQVIIIALNAVLQYYGGADYGDTLITAATIVQSYMPVSYTHLDVYKRQILC